MADATLADFGPRPKRVVPGAHRQLTVGEATVVMGVVNITPDSFSDGGRFLEPGVAVARARQLVDEGAGIIDLGGESTRPGAAEMGAGAEWRRVEPVLRALHDDTTVPLSIDTRHPEVAAHAIDAGADFVNDVSGLRSPAMRKLVAATGAAAVVMHMRGTPATMTEQVGYRDLRAEVRSELATSLARALADGVPADRLLVDPGLGFAKTAPQSLELLAHLGDLRGLGHPVVVGASRKSFLGWLTDGASVADRQDASVAAAVVAALRGADVVRVHDVAPTVRALRVADAVRRGAASVPAPPSRWRSA
ncbi:MAG: dihydropteroate synthase [Thermoplasmata archaeon]|nr:dihydropteroate synthase [Thermoplasmata archaeon]MCI4344140.1 dihydropteroate synthase [Thermoplasmata archaeon]